jgi:RNA polymerase sigma-70 factor (ECF subfamily)
VDEKELIAKSRDGDLAAFELLVRGRRNQVFRIARQIIGEEEGAKDVAQMVFIRLWQVLPRYREGGSFSAYLHRLTVNLAIDFSRRRRHEAPVERMDPAVLEQLPGVPPSASGPAVGEIQRIFRFLARRLSSKQRAAFVLREIEGFTTEEVGEMLGATPSTVRNHVHAARRILQDGLRRLYPEYARERDPEERS